MVDLDRRLEVAERDRALLLSLPRHEVLLRLQNVPGGLDLHQVGHPLPMRTLDALHLASIDFLVQRRLEVRLATYDRCLAALATATGVPIYDLA